MKTYHKGHTVETKEGSHCATIYKCGEIVKMIAGDIKKDGTHNAIDKAKNWIDQKSN